MQRAHRPFLAGVHGLEHRHDLVAPHFADEDATWVMPQGVRDQVMQADAAGALRVRLTRLECR